MKHQSKRPLTICERFYREWKKQPAGAYLTFKEIAGWFVTYTPRPNDIRKAKNIYSGPGKRYCEERGVFLVAELNGREILRVARANRSTTEQTQFEIRRRIKRFSSAGESAARGIAVVADKKLLPEADLEKLNMVEQAAMATTQQLSRFLISGEAPLHSISGKKRNADMEILHRMHSLFYGLDNGHKQVDFLSSKKVAVGMRMLPNPPWPKYANDHEIQIAVAQSMRKFGIQRPRNRRNSETRIIEKAYDLRDFVDVFDMYIPKALPAENETGRG